MDFSQRIKASSLILTKKTVCGSSGDNILAINVKALKLIIFDHFAKGLTSPFCPNGPNLQHFKEVKKIIKMRS